jgi:hypothetical protein
MKLSEHKFKSFVALTRIKGLFIQHKGNLMSWKRRISCLIKIQQAVLHSRSRVECGGRGWRGGGRKEGLRGRSKQADRWVNYVSCRWDVWQICNNIQYKFEQTRRKSWANTKLVFATLNHLQKRTPKLLTLSYLWKDENDLWDLNILFMIFS